MRLIVDGYNVVHAWPDLAAALRSHDLAEVRARLIARLAEHRASTGCQVIIVFDSHSRAPSPDDGELTDGVEVRYGSSLNSADHIIERLCNRAARAGTAGDTIVVTNDRLERSIVSAMGVATMSAQTLLDEVEAGAGDRRGEISKRQGSGLARDRLENRIDPVVRDHLERIRRGDTGGDDPG